MQCSAKQCNVLHSNVKVAGNGRRTVRLYFDWFRRTPSELGMSFLQNGELIVLAISAADLSSPFAKLKFTRWFFRSKFRGGWRHCVPFHCIVLYNIASHDLKLDSSRLRSNFTLFSKRLIRQYNRQQNRTRPYLMHHEEILSLNPNHKLNNYWYSLKYFLGNLPSWYRINGHFYSY